MSWIKSLISKILGKAKDELKELIEEVGAEAFDEAQKLTKDAILLVATDGLSNADKKEKAMQMLKTFLKNRSIDLKDHVIDYIFSTTFRSLKKTEQISKGE